MLLNIGIHIKVRDIKKSEEFYETLGFKKVFEYGINTPISEDYNGRVYELSDCKLEIADGHRAVKNEVFKSSVTSSKISLMVHVKSLKEIKDICVKNNIEICVYPRHYYWGTIEMVVKDPDGVVLVFIQQYDESDAKELNADETFGIPPKS